MGKSLHNKNSRQRKIIIDRWREMQWCITLTPTEIRSSLVKEKENLQRELESERKKNAKLAEEVRCSRSDSSAALHDSQINNGRKRQARKSWDEYTPQYKRQKLKNVKEAAESVLHDKQLEVVDVTVKDKRTGTTMNLDSGHPCNTEYSSADANLLNLLLYAKERFGILNAAYHELSMLFPTLSRSNHLNQRVKDLNKHWTVFPTPEGTIGVQQSLKRLLTDRIEYFLTTSSQTTTFDSSRKIRVKLTGDGTNIGNLHIVVFGFTIPEEGMGTKSAAGNHPLCILRDTEDYEQLRLGLHDILNEIQKNGLVVNGTKYEIDFLLGGDWKFLACVCGIDSATATHSCIWCICSKNERHLDKQWSIVDEECGARTVKGMNAAAALPKGSKKKFNCSNPPLFSMIPMHKVIIDNLHLFLRISDLLINLLILDIRRLDGIEKACSSELGKYQNLSKYIELLKECKIPFHFYMCKDSKKLKWHDLTGPEKHRLFARIDLPNAFPTIPHVQKIQCIWEEFRRLNSLLSSESFTESEIASFTVSAKSWRSNFLEVYQSKNVTPYMHAFVCHVPEFLRIHGAIVPFTQQGLEKLNDSLTQFFYRGSNHRDQEALTQMLQKANRITYLSEHGYQRKVEPQSCSICRKEGHNKRSCPNLLQQCMGNSQPHLADDENMTISESDN